MFSWQHCGLWSFIQSDTGHSGSFFSLLHLTLEVDNVFVVYWKEEQKTQGSDYEHSLTIKHKMSMVTNC